MVLKSTVAAPVAPDTVVNQPWSPSLIFQLKSSICMRTCLAAVSGAVLLHTRELRACRGYIEGNTIRSKALFTSSLCCPRTSSPRSAKTMGTLSVTGLTQIWPSRLGLRDARRS